MQGPPSDRPIITLTTDFGLDDWYVAQMKAVLLSQCPHAQLIDVTHRVPPGDVLCGSITLERAVDGFPAQTVHLAVVDPGVGSARRMLVVRIKNQWVICPDNGLITWTWRRHTGGAAHEIIWRPERSSSTFHGRDVMGPVAATLACSPDALTRLTRPIADPVLLEAEPAGPPAVSGQIIHTDRFGNATTNLLADAVLAQPGADVQLHGISVGTLKRTYTDVAPGQPLALIGSSGLLEIAVRDGSAARQLDLRVGQSVELVHAHRSTAELQALDKQFIWHPFTPMSLWLDSEPLVIREAQGMHLIDSDGRRYLDGVSSLWCNVHGHRVPEIDQAVRRQLDKVAHTTLLGLASEPSILLAERLMRIVPQKLKKIFYSDSGATAAEVAFKLAVQYWHNIGQRDRTEFISFSAAYHGDTFGAMSIGRTEAFHRPFLPLLFPVHLAPSPYVFRSPTPDNAQAVKQNSLRAVEEILKSRAGRIAAIAVEPLVQGAAGMIVHPQGFLSGLRELCDRYNVLLIADEVAVGFGRTGRMFACEHENVQPDLMCLAKGITGGYLPLAATLTTQPIFDAFLGHPTEGRTFFHGHTYTGNPLACAAAIASLDLFEKHNLIQSVQEKSQALSRMLQPLFALNHVGDIRQKGLMVGIELVADRSARTPFDPALRTGARVCQNVRRHGIILRPLGDVVVLMPPLAMPLDDLRRIVEALQIEIAALSS